MRLDQAYASAQQVFYVQPMLSYRQQPRLGSIDHWTFQGQ